MGACTAFAVPEALGVCWLVCTHPSDYSRFHRSQLYFVFGVEVLVQLWQMKLRILTVGRVFGFLCDVTGSKLFSQFGMHIQLLQSQRCRGL